VLATEVASDGCSGSPCPGGGASAHLGQVPGLGGAAYIDSGELPGTYTWLKGQESTENFRLEEESPEK
jgi:hypothetical protein